MINLISILGGLFYRLRGGWWHNLTGGTSPKRWYNGSVAMKFIWSIPTGYLMFEASNGPLWLLPISIICIYFAQSLFGTGQYLQDVPLRLPDLLGFYRNALAALPVFYYSPLLFALYAVLGSLHAGMYWLGFKVGGNGDYGDVILGVTSWLLIIQFIGLNNA